LLLCGGGWLGNWPAAVNRMAEVLRGGLDAGRAAQCHVAGGHSIDDPEPKYGMAVTGTADRAPCCASTPHCRPAA
jgi:selenophosphate synthase